MKGLLLIGALGQLATLAACFFVYRSHQATCMVAQIDPKADHELVVTSRTSFVPFFVSASCGFLMAASVVIGVIFDLE